MLKGLGRFARQNTIALLALFLALGGTSFAAAALINGSQIKPHTIAKNRLTNKAIAQLKGNRGPQGPAGAAGAAGAAGQRGPTGAQGVAGTAVAYAYINGSAGTLDATRSKNILDLQKQTTGVYCLKLGFTPVNAVASLVRDSSTPGDVVTTKVPPNGSSCQAIYGNAYSLQLVVTVGAGGTLHDGDVMVNIN
jgi:hypothetical protein